MTNSESDAQSSGTHRTTLLIVFVVVFIDLLGFGIVLPLLPRYGLHFRASHATLGLLMAAFSAMQFLFAPMWGSLSDRIGRRPVLLIGLVGSTLSYLLFGIATALGRDGSLLGFSPLTWLFVSRIGAGIAGATIATAQAVIADSTGAAGRGKGMALIGAAFGIGFTFGPLIGAMSASDAPSLALSDEQYASIREWSDVDDTITAEQLTAELGTLSDADTAAVRRYLKEPRPRGDVRADLLEPPSAVPGYVAAALSLLAFLFALMKLPESRPPNAGPADGGRADGGRADGGRASGGRANGSRRGWLQMGALVRHVRMPQFTAILMSVFITTFAFAQFESTLSLLTREFGYSDTRNFVFFAYIGFVLMIGQGVLVRRLLPRVGEHRMATAGVILMTIGFLVIAATGTSWIPGAVLWVILPVITIGFSAVTPSLQSLLSQSAGDDEQGAVLGTGQSLSSLARILGPYVGLRLLGESIALPYCLAAGLMILGGIQIMRMKTAAASVQPDEA